MMVFGLCSCTIDECNLTEFVPAKCGCRYIPSALQGRCRAIGGHTHCPMCRLVVPYSLTYWQQHVTDICSLPREEHLLLTLAPGALFDASNSGSPTSTSSSSSTSNANSFKVQVCLICTKMFRDEERLKRHYMFNHWMETNIDFRVAHQIDPIRGLYAVINYGNFFVQVTYFVKQYNTANCYVCPGGPDKLRKCPHFETVLQNPYPVEEYSVPENVLSQLPLDVVNRYRKLEEAAARNGVPAMVALKTPPHAEATLFSIFDEDNLLKRYTVLVLSSQKSISSAASSEISNWHRLLVKLVESDTNRTAKCGFNLTEMKTFLDNCKLSLGKRSAQLAADSLLLSGSSGSEGKTPAPTQDALKLVLGRLNHEIDLLQEEVSAFRSARIQRYGEYVPPEAETDPVQQETEPAAPAHFDEKMGAVYVPEEACVNTEIIQEAEQKPQTMVAPEAVVEEELVEEPHTVTESVALNEDRLQIEEEQTVEDESENVATVLDEVEIPLGESETVVDGGNVVEEEVVTEIVESSEPVLTEELSASEESTAEEKSEGHDQTTDPESDHSQSTSNNSNRTLRKSKRALKTENEGSSPPRKRRTRAK